MYVLGIDPGLSETGFGIVRVTRGEPEFVDCGIIKTSPKESFSERLTIIKSDLEEILRTHEFAAAGVEELFFVKNVTNGIKVAHARGVIIESLHAHKIPLREWKPREIKNNICGYGGADKKQMQEMVQRLLKLKTLPRPHDAADALGIAICTSRIAKD